MENNTPKVSRKWKEGTEKATYRADPCGAPRVLAFWSILYAFLLQWMYFGIFKRYGFVLMHKVPKICNSPNPHLSSWRTILYAAGGSRMIFIPDLDLLLSFPISCVSLQPFPFACKYLRKRCRQSWSKFFWWATPDSRIAFFPRALPAAGSCLP